MKLPPDVKPDWAVKVGMAQSTCIKTRRRQGRGGIWLINLFGKVWGVAANGPSDFFWVKHFSISVLDNGGITSESLQLIWFTSVIGMSLILATVHLIGLRWREVDHVLQLAGWTESQRKWRVGSFRSLGWERHLALCSVGLQRWKIETGSHVFIHSAQNSCITWLFFCHFKHFKHLQTSSDHCFSLTVDDSLCKIFRSWEFPSIFCRSTSGIYLWSYTPWLSPVHLTLGRLQKTNHWATASAVRNWEYDGNFEFNAWKVEPRHNSILKNWRLYGGYALLGKSPYDVRILEPRMGRVDGFFQMRIYLDLYYVNI